METQDVKFETVSGEPSASAQAPETSLGTNLSGTVRLEGVSARDLLHHLFGILFTVTEVADCLKVHRVKVLGWIRDGYLPAINVQSQRSCRALWRIHGSDLIRMAKENVVNLPTHSGPPVPRTDAVRPSGRKHSPAAGSTGVLPSGEDVLLSNGPGVPGESSARSTKLASALQTGVKGKVKRKTLIETKGDGGYCVSPPTAAACHKTGRHYRVISEFQ